MHTINEIEDLIKLISKLPGLGPKSAKRIVLKLINNQDQLVKPLAKALASVYKNISRCKICGVLKSSAVDCSYDNCKVIQRKYNQICVVENIADQWSIENSNIFKGYFHRNFCRFYIRICFIHCRIHIHFDRIIRVISKFGQLICIRGTILICR